jgi:hypothetical protein
MSWNPFAHPIKTARRVAGVFNPGPRDWNSPSFPMNDPGISGRDTQPSDYPQRQLPDPHGLRAPRRRWDVNGGDAGGAALGQMLTPTNQANITRPRQVTLPPVQQPSRLGLETGLGGPQQQLATPGLAGAGEPPPVPTFKGQPPVPGRNPELPTPTTNPLQRPPLEERDYPTGSRTPYDLGQQQTVWDQVPGGGRVRQGRVAGEELGIDVTGASGQQRDETELEMRRQTAPGIKISRVGDRIVEEPPQRSPSKLKNALALALRGAVIGMGDRRGVGGAIGGALAGALGGGVSPALSEKFQQQENIAEMQGRVAAGQELELKSAHIGGVQAQAQADLWRARHEAWQMENAQAGIYVSPDGQVTRMSPKEAEQAYAHDRDEAGRNARAAAAQQEQNRRAAAAQAGATARTNKAIAARGAAGGGTQAAIAAEGAEETKQAAARTAAINAELDSLRKEVGPAERAIAEKEALLQQITDRIQGEHGRWTKERVAAAARAELDSRSPKPDFASGEYDRSVAATKQKRERMAALEKELEGVGKEGRTGAGKAARVPAGRGKPTATTHHFSINGYIQRNPGATEADARAFAAANYPGYQVGP